MIQVGSYRDRFACFPDFTTGGRTDDDVAQRIRIKVTPELDLAIGNGSPLLPAPVVLCADRVRLDGHPRPSRFARGNGANEGDDGGCGIPLGATVVPSQLDQQHAGKQRGQGFAAVRGIQLKSFQLAQEGRAHVEQSAVGGV